MGESDAELSATSEWSRNPLDGAGVADQGRCDHDSRCRADRP